MHYEAHNRRNKWAMGALSFGIYAVYAIGFLAVLLLCYFLLRGMVWAAGKSFPWLITASEVTIAICLILSPLCISSKLRSMVGRCYYYSSFLLGIMMFAFSCLLVVFLWGYGGLFVGLILGGVGVVPIALLAALLHREWLGLIELIAGLILTFGLRFLGLRLAIGEEKILAD